MKINMKVKWKDDYNNERTGIVIDTVAYDFEVRFIVLIEESDRFAIVPVANCTRVKQEIYHIEPPPDSIDDLY